MLAPAEPQFAVHTAAVKLSQLLFVLDDVHVLYIN